MFVVEDRNLWEEARWLRSQGWSVRRIARHLDVSLSSASGWTRGAAPAEPSPPIEARSSRPKYEPLHWCSRCSRLRPESCFNRFGSGLQWWCRDCFKAYYAEKREHHRKRSNALKAQRVREAQAFVLEYLRSHPCRDCGEGDPVVLEFDHVGEKRAEVSTLVRRGVRLPAVELEMARCHVVCANCHRRRTARRSGWWRLDTERAGSWRSAAHERNVRIAIDALAGGCIDCGLRELCLLDFDHVGEKTCSVMRLARNEVSLARLATEIARCQVRCANCHRRRTSRHIESFRATAEIPPARVELALRG